MSKLRTALLTAATLAVIAPSLAAAQAPPPDQNGGWHGRGDHGDRGGPPNGGQPQQPGQPGGGRPDFAPGRDRGPGDRPDGRGFGPGDRRPDGFRPNGPSDQRGFGPGDRRPDGYRPGNPDNGRGFGPGDRRPDGYRPGNPDNGRGFGPGDRRGYGGRGGPDWNRGPDHGWDRGRGPDWGARNPGAWRGDRRYDWQGWRNQHRELFLGQRYFAPRGYYYRPFSPGIRIEPFFYGRTYWIDDPYAYRLPPAYGPYRWVRYFDDVLLVDLRTGVVMDSIRGFFL